MKIVPTLNIRALNSATKYPSIPTYHRIGDRGRLADEVLVPFPDDGTEHLLTEKVDGTNTRIVLFPKTGEYLVGSREEWLTYGGDLISNPSQGIVEALGELPIILLAKLHENPLSADPHVLVIYGEVYGGKINAAKNYTATGKYDMRVFDLWSMDLEAFKRNVLDRDLETIAKLRDSGGQPFMASKQFESVTEMLRLARVPLLGWGGLHLPSSVEETFAMMKKILPETSSAKIDGSGGPPEGLVIRTHDRSRIAKLRVEDYARTLGGGKRR